MSDQQSAKSFHRMQIQGVSCLHPLPLLSGMFVLCSTGCTPPGTAHNCAVTWRMASARGRSASLPTGEEQQQLLYAAILVPAWGCCHCGSAAGCTAMHVTAALILCELLSACSAVMRPVPCSWVDLSSAALLSALAQPAYCANHLCALFVVCLLTTASRSCVSQTTATSTSHLRCRPLLPTATTAATAASPQTPPLPTATPAAAAAPHVPTARTAATAASTLQANCQPLAARAQHTAAAPPAPTVAGPVGPAATTAQSASGQVTQGFQQVPLQQP